MRTAEGIRLVQGVGERVELTDPHKVIDEDLVGRVVIIHRTEGVHVHD